MLNFTPVREQKMTYADLAKGLTVKQLRKHVDDMIDTVLKIIADAKDRDVVMTPVDPQANDTFAANEADKGIAWSLGHVIVHGTASSEESAALALELARGLTVEKRSRYETPWETVKTIAQCRKRLEESRRMQHAMLSAWPDKPSTITYTPSGRTFEINCTARFILGLSHQDSHLEQLREIMRQAMAARAPKKAVKTPADKR